MSIRTLIASAGALLLVLTCNVHAQTAWPTPDGKTAAGGLVCMTLNGSGQAVPCSDQTALRNLGAGTLATGQVSVGATATAIAAARAGRHQITVTNDSTTDVFLGGLGVTASTGVMLPGTKGASVTLPFTGALYGIVASGTETVSFTELY